MPRLYLNNTILPRSSTASKTFQASRNSNAWEA
jgi:hypothetical protein